MKNNISCMLTIVVQNYPLLAVFIRFLNSKIRLRSKKKMILSPAPGDKWVLILTTLKILLQLFTSLTAELDIFVRNLVTNYGIVPIKLFLQLNLLKNYAIHF